VERVHAKWYRPYPCIALVGAAQASANPNAWAVCGAWHPQINYGKRLSGDRATLPILHA